MSDQKLPGVNLTPLYEKRPRVFWIIFVAISVMSIWFIYTSHDGLAEIIDELHMDEKSTTENFLVGKTQQVVDMDKLELVARTSLEYDTLNKRHEMTSSYLATRTWLRFMASAFGAILIFIGSIFVLSKIETRVPTVFTVGGEEKAQNFNLNTTSPGLILALFGSLLMLLPLMVKQNISTDDTASFFAKPITVIGTDSTQTVTPAETAEGKATIANILEGLEKDD